ncbi:MAG: metal-binding protein [Chloroflexi bacterium]|nr:metal-binding protein [Chloroflexota bacterium]
MPMGRTHRLINTYLCVPLVVGATVAAHWSPLQALSCGVGYCFATFFMNPDLDLDSVGYQSWGPLRIIWWPYQKILAHRSYFSHFPVISTVLRIVYLMWFPVLMIALLGSSVQMVARETIFDWWPIIGAYLLMFILGMIVSDTLHAILDVVSTDFKRHFSRHSPHHQSFWEHHGERRKSRARPSPKHRRR